MTPSFRRHCGALLLALCGTATHAAASDSYPDDIKRKLSLSELPVAPPSCTLCHSDDEGGAKSVVKPFGLSLMRAGATGGHLPSLLAALDVLEDEGEDSDGDGIPDIAELRAGSDPNLGADGSAPEQVPLPQTGCGVHAGGPAAGAWSLTVCALLWLARRRRR